ncbi:MAG: hypothetical protein IKP73_06635 [Bacteroidales bacterium]|nr:hypothetical protein [Bacteroidales bacterium]
MKTKYLYSCMLLSLVLASGCIKDEGELLTIVRTDVDTSTVITEHRGYMKGVAERDEITTNFFDKVLNGSNQIEELNCYTGLKTNFKSLDAARNGGNVVRAGYVYSHTNKLPVISDTKDCKTTYVSNPNGSGAEVSFEGTLTKLDPNSTYFVRSFVVCEGDGKSDSVIYNNHVLEYKTVLPEDVWVQRNDAPSDLFSRADAFSCVQGESVYIYGGRNGSTRYSDLWRYNPNTDTWEQLGTFEAKAAHYVGTEKRSNGAMFAYPNITARDTLLYIVGGELSSGKYTGTVFIYSTERNRFANAGDHPNAGTMYPDYDEKGMPIYKTDEEGNIIEPKTPRMSNKSRAYVEDLPIYKKSGTGQKTNYGLAGAVAFTLSDNGFTKYFIAFGKNDLSTDGQKHVQTTVYEYDVMYDRTCNGINELSEWAWKSVQSGNDKDIEGFYQPVCVKCGDRVVIGSGETSRTGKDGVSRNFYTVSYSITEQSIRMEALPTNDAFTSGFKERANASAFYLNYVKDGAQYDRFYVGCGRTCKEENFIMEPEQLLNDFWCYDFNSRQWIRKADCSNVLRQGAVGFSVKRMDDVFVKKQFSVNLRGMFSFGEGYVPGEGFNSRKDNWEYIP